MYKPYNSKDKNSIYRYAKKLEGKSFNQVCLENSPFQEDQDNGYIMAFENKKRKGGLGEIIEEFYFRYKPDNRPEADFPEAGLELKVTPYKINKNESLSAKERLIIAMINYMKIIDMDFYDSNAWVKIENILLIFYLWEPEIKNRLDYLINFVYLFSPPVEDLQIIENDFYKIRQKVIDGKAHELSEGDTMYLGAATKAATSGDKTEQPNSKIMAKPRAFSFKSSYMTHILRKYVLASYEKNDTIVKGKQVSPFEDYVIEMINRYIGTIDTELFQLFFGNEHPKGKNKYSRLSYEILGVKTKNAEEFEKANIVLKAIRIEENGRMIESMSFPTFKIKELIQEEWESSCVYQYFSETKFLFVVYKKQKGHYRLNGATFWNMPFSDIEGKLKEEWVRARDIFRDGVKLTISTCGKKVNNNLPKEGNTEILHVRPHALKAAYLINGEIIGNGKLEKDTDDLPNGDKMTKQCFWLNNKYIIKNIQDIL